MKNMKKLVSVLLAVVMMMAMTTGAWAEKGTNAVADGKITITGSLTEQSYSIYKIFDLESFDNETNKFSYKIDTTSPWWGFVNNEEYFEFVDGQGDSTVKYVLKTKVDDTAAEAFAKAALAYAEKHGITATETKETGEGNVEFTGLALGYYLVDSSTGALCGLNTTDRTVEIAEKNKVPTITKEVQEDNDEEWGATNSAKIGDTVNFKTTIYAKKGAESYVLHDEMSAGLTLKAETIKVTVGTTELTAGSEYTLKTDGFAEGHNCDFEIAFEESYLETITGDTTIVVTYSAILNDDAVISENQDNAENTNKTKLDFGNESTTVEQTTKTYTYKFDLVKTTSDNTVLDGAEFKLYTAKTGGSEVVLVEEGTAEGFDHVYRVATNEEIETGVTAATIQAGVVMINGLDLADGYWLEETKAPEGYNKLHERVNATLAEGNNNVTITANKWTEGGVQVVNYTGTELPTTGGMGTTILYIAGGVLVLLAVVLLFVKRRSNSEA